MSRIRIAVLSGDNDVSIIERYLPQNYMAEYVGGANIIVISGVDNAGWTMDDYVIPRLESGNYYPKEIYV